MASAGTQGNNEKFLTFVAATRKRFPWLTPRRLLRNDARMRTNTPTNQLNTAIGSSGSGKRGRTFFSAFTEVVESRTIFESSQSSTPKHDDDDDDEFVDVDEDEIIVVVGLKILKPEIPKVMINIKKI